MLLQIHDELIFEVNENDVKKYSKIIQDEMSSVKDSNLHSFSIPLLVDIDIFGMLSIFQLHFQYHYSWWAST